MSPGDTVTFNHIKIKALVIGLTEDNISCLIIKGLDEQLTLYQYKTRLEYDSLVLYTYENQDASLLFNRAFSGSDRYAMEKMQIVPSTLKEIVSEKLLLTQSSVRYLNRNIPSEWILERIIDVTRGTALSSILLVDFRITNLAILCVMRHKEDAFNLLLPMAYLRNVYANKYEL